ncbi:XRE family transcriptional regulator [Methylovulum psychrotolerans]|uniref:helix-turn-helix domain-containing protein n=1 Tax=Methylovulum psychrotolerans TaxID=1704499 RepID=UPI001BFF126A|nr:helix-turn-helix transcriptional regulator [Methylovulum psychrotolerans]MBT9096511.1 XRE family transcriptional regulator [Methylovulum psychrotolerans]
MNPHIGSDFDDFLAEEGLSEEVEAAAMKKVIACLIAQNMTEAHITKAEMARRMNTSRAQLDRLLNPNCHSVTLTTLVKAAAAVGKKISISLEDGGSSLAI